MKKQINVLVTDEHISRPVRAYGPDRWVLLIGAEFSNSARAYIVETRPRVVSLIDDIAASGDRHAVPLANWVEILSGPGGLTVRPGLFPQVILGEEGNAGKLACVVFKHNAGLLEPPTGAQLIASCESRTGRHRLEYYVLEPDASLHAYGHANRHLEPTPG